MSTDQIDVAVAGGPSMASMFVSSAPVAFLDYFRTPYHVGKMPLFDGTEQLQQQAGGPALVWPREGTAQRAAAAIVHGVPDIPIFASVLPDSVVEPLLARRGGAWSLARKVTRADGSALASIWRGEDGSVFLPFDPDEVIVNYWRENYLAIANGAKARAFRRSMRVGYYRLRPILPRPLQIWLRRRFARVQARSLFPGWPIEPCLHDFFDLLFAILAGIAGGPIPRIAAWPDGYTWALVLTHDVEHPEGLESIDPVLELERTYGLRSSWNFVPRRYEVDAERVSGLVADGFEVGVHGLHHDGRDLESFATWRKRLPEAHDAAERWGAVGFRSAALHRHWEWMKLINFEYDSSCPDTDPFEPQDGGCCSWLPFVNGEMVELPLTLPQDHTLFVILGQYDETVWVEKARFLRERGGLALIDTHPDYLVDSRIFLAYSRFLDRFARDSSAWKALPREVSSWWRRRADSWLEPDSGGWQVAGPAAGEGRVELYDGSW